MTDGHAHHDHGAHHHVSEQADRRYLAIALVLIVGLMIGEVVTAVVGHSLALFADAGHMLTDAAALAVSIWTSRLASRPETGVFTFGLKRAGILSAAFNGVSLVAIGCIIAVEAILRLIHPQSVNGHFVLVVALVGAAVNIAATGVLSRADRTSLNIKGAFVHLLTDLYAFFGTAIAGAIIIFTGFRRADAIASLFVVVLISYAAWGLLRDSGKILLEAAPEQIDLSEVRLHLLEVDHVVDVHDLHAWTVTSGMPSLSAHVVLEDHCFATGHAPQLLDRLQGCLEEHFAIEHATFQLEPVSHAAHESGAHS